MGSLTGCLSKAGDALPAEDRRAILELADTFRKQGMKPDEAARAAIEQQAGFVRWSMETAKAEMDGDTTAASARQFAQELPPGERGGMLGGVGLNEAGAQRLRRDNFAAAYGGNADLLDLLDAAGMRNVSDGLLQAAPAVVRGDVGGIINAARAMARGEVPPEMAGAAEALKMRSGSPDAVAGLVEAGGDPLVQARIADAIEQHPDLAVRMDAQADALPAQDFLKMIRQEAARDAEDAELLKAAAECALDAGI